MGYIHDQTGSFSGGLIALAVTGAIGMVIVLLLRHDTSLEAAPGKRAIVK